jgi:D-beta-D-heptose 7-phosphate kinase/D-beta-D-heptose 1-phosphate adenosyltransferase
MGRVLAPRSFVRAAREHQSRGEQVVFTNGVFDLLHYGHVSYLQKAKKRGHVLFVALNTDRSVRRLKGKSRPLTPLKDRAYTLAALACVDAVTHFDEDTPAELIARVRPDVLVKGADYKTREIVGADTVVSHGGRVIRIPVAAGRSTSALIRKIQRTK